MSATSTAIECQLCGCFSPNLNLYVSHLRLVHSKDQSFNIQCGIDSCAEVYSAFAAFNSHVYRHHRVALGLKKPSSIETTFHCDVDDCSVNIGEPAAGDGAANYANEDGADSHLSKAAPLALPAEAARFLLHL